MDSPPGQRVNLQFHVLEAIFSKQLLSSALASSVLATSRFISQSGKCFQGNTFSGFKGS